MGYKRLETEKGGREEIIYMNKRLDIELKTTEVDEVNDSSTVIMLCRHLFAFYYKENLAVIIQCKT